MYPILVSQRPYIFSATTRQLDVETVFVTTFCDKPSVRSWIQLSNQYCDNSSTHSETDCRSDSSYRSGRLAQLAHQQSTQHLECCILVCVELDWLCTDGAGNQLLCWLWSSMVDAHPFHGILSFLACQRFCLHLCSFARVRHAFELVAVGLVLVLCSVLFQQLSPCVHRFHTTTSC